MFFPASERYSSRIRSATPVGLWLMLLIALALSVSASVMSRLPGDLHIVRWTQSLSTPWLDNVMEMMSFLGQDHIVVGSILILAVGLALARRWQEGLAFLSALLLDGMLLMIKVLIDRPRPPEELVSVIDSASGFSFPSGHVYHAVLFWGLLLALVVIRLSRPWLRRGMALLLVALIFLIAVSRVYLGAHWPSDVLGSVTLGIPSVALLFYMCQRLKGVQAAPS